MSKNLFKVRVDFDDEHFICFRDAEHLIFNEEYVGASCNEYSVKFKINTIKSFTIEKEKVLNINNIVMKEGNTNE